MPYNPYEYTPPPTQQVYANSYEPAGYATTYANSVGYAAAPVSYPTVPVQGYAVAQQVSIKSNVRGKSVWYRKDKHLFKHPCGS